MPEHKQLTFPLAVKSVDDAGSFVGILAAYGNRDLGGDIVDPGAIKEFDLTADGHIRIFDSHNSHEPIGKGRLTDTPQGLHIEGKLNLAVQRAREVLALMKDGIISGLSIGYSILKDGAKYVGGVRHLTALKLHEGSLVAFPMNPLAQVTSVKKLPECKTIGDWEGVLRAVGVSKRKARVLAIHDWPIIDGPEPEADFAELTEQFNSTAKE